MDDASSPSVAHELRQRLRRLDVLLADGDRQVLEPVDLTPTQVDALRALAADGRAGTTVSGLARSLLCTRGNAARLVRRLQQGGLVAVRDDPDDRRLVRVSLTRAGRDRLSTAERVLGDLDDRRLAVVEEHHLVRLVTAAAAVESALLAPQAPADLADADPGTAVPGPGAAPPARR